MPLKPSKWGGVTKDTALDDLWKHFEKQCIPPVATTRQRKAMRDCFFFGAHGLYTVIGEYQREINETNPDDAALQSMAKEFGDRLAREFRVFFHDDDDPDNGRQH